MTEALGQATILVVDDAHENIDVLSGILREEYKVKAATTGEKALEIVETSKSIELILLDIMMPGMDGYEVCRQLKADDHSKDIPVIFVSALQDMQDRVKGFAAGGADFLIKPIQPEEVLARVKVHVQNARMQRQLQQAHDQLESRVAERTHELEETNTTLRETYRRIVRSEKQYRGLLEASPDGVILVNEAGEIELANTAMSDLFGYSSDELRGMAVDHLVPQQFHDHQSCRNGYFHSPAQRRIGSFAHQNSAERNTIFGLKKDGTEFPVDISLSPVANERGNMVIADIRDQTDRLSLEDQLNQAQKMEALGQLTGGIAHDFNNILCIIIAYAELAQDDKISQEKIQKSLQEILRAGERARDLVAQMLVFSRGAGKQEKRVIDVAPLLMESMKLLRPVLPSSIDLNFNIDDDLAHVKADPVQINQLVMNLFINARDAMGESGLIELGVRNVELDTAVCSSCFQAVSGEFVEISVTDNGPGIDAEKLKRVFEPFFTTKDVGKGTGMGLAMVHGIMHNCNGHVMVDSVPGAGSRFRLLFPVSEPPLVEVAVNDQVGDMDFNGDGETILVVDDEEIIGLFLYEMLSGRGYNVVSFSDSVEAFKYFSKHRKEVDLVITDQTMPKLTGVDMAQAMLELRKDLPIILATGFSQIVDADKANALGISAFFQKPLNTKLLLKEMKALLAN